MGWGSATNIFDEAVGVATRLYGPITDSNVAYVVAIMYNEVDWGDWDTQDESKYFDKGLKRVMIARGEIDPDDI